MSTGNSTANFMSKGQTNSKVQIARNENVIIVFRHMTKPKWPAYSIHIDEYISPIEMLRFCDICLSVYHIPHISLVYSVLERCRNFIFYGILLLNTSEWWSNFKMTRGQAHWERKCKKKIVFLRISL